MIPDISRCKCRVTDRRLGYNARGFAVVLVPQHPIIERNGTTVFSLPEDASFPPPEMGRAIDAALRDHRCVTIDCASIEHAFALFRALMLHDYRLRPVAA